MSDNIIGFGDSTMRVMARPPSTHAETIWGRINRGPMYTKPGQFEIPGMTTMTGGAPLEEQPSQGSNKQDMHRMIGYGLFAIAAVTAVYLIVDR